MILEECLRGGVFCVTSCDSCRRTVWPPSRYCNACLGRTILRPYRARGVVLEFSSRQGAVFCVCRFGGELNLMGRMTSGECRVGMSVTISRCGMSDGKPVFEFSPL